MSVISRLIDRFRKAQPLDEASRGRVATEDDFWWIGNAGDGDAHRNNNSKSAVNSSILSTRSDFSGIKELVKNNSTDNAGNDTSSSGTVAAAQADPRSDTTDMLFDKSFMSGGGPDIIAASAAASLSVSVLSNNVISTSVVIDNESGNHHSHFTKDDLNTSVVEPSITSIDKGCNESALPLSEENLDAYATSLLKQCDNLLQTFRLAANNNTALRSSDDASYRDKGVNTGAAVHLHSPRRQLASSWGSAADQIAGSYVGLSVNSSLSDCTYAFADSAVSNAIAKEPALQTDAEEEDSESGYVPMEVEEEAEGYVMVAPEALTRSADSERSVFRHLGMSVATGDASAISELNNICSVSSSRIDASLSASSTSHVQNNSGDEPEGSPNRIMSLYGGSSGVSDYEVEFVSLINEIINNISDKINTPSSNPTVMNNDLANRGAIMPLVFPVAAIPAAQDRGDDYADDYDNFVVTDIIEDILRSTFEDPPVARPITAMPAARVAIAATIITAATAAPPHVDPIDKLCGFDAGSLLTTEAIRALWGRINV